MLLLVFLAPTFFSSSVNAQDNCTALVCGDLRLEIVRQDTNVSTGCPSSSPPCTDKFRQISYKVYLRSKKEIPNPNVDYEPFNLDYKLLDVAVKLKQNSTPQYSHIDVVSTQSCFEGGAGASWHNYVDSLGDKVIFSPTDSSVSISFANLAAGSDECGSTGPNGTGNVIRFDETSPPFTAMCGSSQSDRCLYIELFTVVVNAYPGETLQFVFDGDNKYEPKSPVSVCTPIPFVSTNTGRNGTFPLQVGVPRLYTGTQNEGILAELLPSVPDGFGGRFFPVRIKNIDTVNLSVTRLEFVLKASLFQMTEPFSYSGAEPREYSGGVDPNNGQDIKYLHYLISPSGLTLGPGGMDTLSIIKIGPPSLENLGWSASLSFQSADTKSRIKTTNFCTTLQTSGATSNTHINGDTICLDPNIRFKVEGNAAGCDSLVVKVGIRSSTPANIRIKKLEFELDFSWSSSGISFSGLNYNSSWPSGGLNCATSGCFGTAPFKVCFDTIGKIFKYCYETPDTNAPLFILNDFASMEIRFNMEQNGCIDNVKVKKLKITYSFSDDPCIPGIDPVVGFPVCGPLVSGMVVTETGEGVEEVRMKLDGAILAGEVMGMDSCSVGSCSSSCVLDTTLLTKSEGGYGFCQICTTCNHLKVIPEKKDNPLNGVTTYDLVLISKHILGSDPFASPYKMIAADANKSGSITSFDIVEFRKLILGIYTNLPNNNSWRFVDSSFVFPIPNNPFQTQFPEGVNCIAPPAVGVDFIGVKVGDVDNTAVGNRPALRPNTQLSWPSLRATPGGVLTVPITYSGSVPMEAVQLGLRFDPAKLQLIGPSKGDIESYLPDNFNLLRANQGEIRTLWIPMTEVPESIQSGAVLFYLSFKVLGEMPGEGLPLWLDDQLLACATWGADGVEWAVQSAPSLVKRDGSLDTNTGLQAALRPNPTLGDATLGVQSLKSEKCRVAVYDAFGRRLFLREVMLQEGRQDIPLPEVANLPSGVYTWKVYTQNLQAQGHLIKQ